MKNPWYTALKTVTFVSDLKLIDCKWITNSKFTCCFHGCKSWAL